jgi:predicted DNA-binding protein (UPF0251 family)
MARPIKSRTICSEPKINIFGPRNLSEEIYIDMSLEEFEAIRLIDYNNLTQEECASFMGVARTTVQKIYDDARGKIADALVNGKILKIEGGNYHLCNNMPHGKYCNRKNCKRFSE